MPLGRLLLGVAERLRGSDTLRLVEEIAPAPFVSRERALAAQFGRLSALLAHAEAHVPYYREMFRSLGIRARDVRSLDDFARLPVLTKDIVRDRSRDLVRDDVPFETLSAHHSGGSTGVPLKFYRDRHYMNVCDAAVHRNMMQCGYRPGDMVAFFWGGSDKIAAMPGLEFEVRQRLRRMYQFDPFRSGPADMDKWARRWRSLRPKAALGYASTVARFAAHLEARGTKPAPLAGVFTTAEKLYRPQRETISRVFGCRVFDCYGSSEVQNIATECRAGRMHVNADFVVLETEPGPQPAPLLVTSLRNMAMPFIRYRNEDCGTLLAGECECGSGFPLMQLDIARVSDNFVLPDGRVVHGEFFTHLMYGSEGIGNFQFHQTAPGAITLSVVPVGGAVDARERAVAAAVRDIEALAPGAIRVEVRITDAIPLSAAGKHRFTRSDVPEGRN